MTIFPEQPKLEAAEPKDGKEMRRLVEDHITAVKVIFGWSLIIVVKAGYKTDGASVPQFGRLSEDPESEKKLIELIRKYYPEKCDLSAFNSIIGTPWDLPRLLAAIVHDGLYGIKWAIRFLCDRVYKWILQEADYDFIKRELEYDVIRLFGWRNWNAVTDEEIEESKKLVSVEWIRTKNVKNRIEELIESGKGE